MMSSHSSNASTMRRAIRWAITLLVLAVVLWFAGGTLQQAWQQLSATEVHLSLGWSIVAALIYLVALAPMAAYWGLALRSLGQHPRTVDLIRGYYLGHLGKYVPGKAMVIALRTGVLKGAGCDARATVVSLFLETLTFMATGAAMAAAMLVIQGNGGPAHVGLALALAAVAGLPVTPPIAKRLARLVLKKRNGSISSKEPASKESASKESADLLDGITWPLALTGLLAASLSWSVLGLSLWATLRAVGVESAMPFSQIGLWIESSSLPMVAGFLSLLPGGVVVRDTLVVELLTPQISPETALLAAALWRLVTVLSEFALCGIMEATRLGRQFFSPPP